MSDKEQEEIQTAERAGKLFRNAQERETWSKLAADVRDQWSTAADNLGETLCQAGRQIQRAGHASADDVAGAVDGAGELLREQGLQGMAAVTAANDAAEKARKVEMAKIALLATAVARGRRRKQAELQETSDNLAQVNKQLQKRFRRAGAFGEKMQKQGRETGDKLGSAFGETSKMVRRRWTAGAAGLAKTFARSRKRTRKGLADTAESLGDVLGQTGKTAQAGLDNLSGAVTHALGRTKKSKRQVAFENVGRVFGKAARGGEYLLLARLGLKKSGALAGLTGKKARSKAVKLPKQLMKQQKRSFTNSPWAWLAAAGVGAGLMYFLDPQSGGRRWLAMRGQADNMSGGEDRTYGAAGMMAGNGSELQGGWTPVARILAGVAGGLLTVSGARARGPMGIARSMAGFGLLALGVIKRPSAQLAGSSMTQTGIQVNKSIEINAPVHDVFNVWRRFDNFPRFMSHVIEVRDLGNNRSHWVVEGPAGSRVSWDAVTTRMVSNAQIAWESEPGSTVNNSGSVRFMPAGDGGTLIEVQMTYNPPAGMLGHAVATFFGSDPQQQMDDDLARFKTLVETGQFATGDYKL